MQDSNATKIHYEVMSLPRWNLTTVTKSMYMLICEFWFCSCYFHHFGTCHANVAGRNLWTHVLYPAEQACKNLAKRALAFLRNCVFFMLGYFFSCITLYLL